MRKKLKDKSFARQVNRQDILTGFDEMDTDPDQHIAFVVDAMKPLAKELGLAG